MRLLAVLLIILATSCDYIDKPSYTGDYTVEKEKETALELTLNNLLSKKYSNYHSNELVRKEASKELKVKIDSLIPTGALKEIPLEIFSIKDNPHGKGSIIHFYTSNSYSDKLPRYTKQLQFDIIGLMDDSLAMTLSEGSKYLLDYEELTRLDKTQARMLVNRTYNGTEFGIEKSSSYTDINLGVYLAEVTALKPYRKY